MTLLVYEIPRIIDEDRHLGASQFDLGSKASFALRLATYEIVLSVQSISSHLPSLIMLDPHFFTTDMNTALLTGIL